MRIDSCAPFRDKLWQTRRREGSRARGPGRIPPHPAQVPTHSEEWPTLAQEETGRGADQRSAPGLDGDLRAGFPHASGDQSRVQRKRRTALKLQVEASSPLPVRPLLPHQSLSVPWTLASAPPALAGNIPVEFFCFVSGCEIVLCFVISLG